MQPSVITRQAIIWTQLPRLLLLDRQMGASGGPRSSLRSAPSMTVPYLHAVTGALPQPPQSGFTWLRSLHGGKVQRMPQGGVSRPIDCRPMSETRSRCRHKKTSPGGRSRTGSSNCTEAARANLVWESGQ
jgi:hypothetical protein